MKRWICLLLIMSGVLLAGLQTASSHMSIAKAFSTPAEDGLAYTGDDDNSRKTLRAERNKLDDKKERKGLGATFWGGPYWGYGPRWGHACESCRTGCEGGQNSARCERCRVRCGW